MDESHQLPLLTDTNIARRRDPKTSHDAARKVTKSGKRASQQLAVLAYVREFPGLTSRELALKARFRGADGLDYEVFHKRLPEIAADHDRNAQAKNPMVKKGPERECEVTGYRATTWYEIGAEIPPQQEELQP